MSQSTRTVLSVSWTLILKLIHRPGANATHAPDEIARAELRQLAVDAGARRRFAPHQLHHAHAVEVAREGVAVNDIQRQLGHSDLGTTSTYLQGIDPSEIIDAVRFRRQPTISATAGLNL